MLIETSYNSGNKKIYDWKLELESYIKSYTPQRTKFFEIIKNNINLIDKKIEQSKFMLSLWEDYSFENNFIKIELDFWEKASLEIKKIWNKVTEKFLIENKINFNIKPWKDWNIILYLDKKWISMILNFNSKNIIKSTYSIVYFLNGQIYKHFGDYEFNSSVKDILFYFRGCLKYDWW